MGRFQPLCHKTKSCKYHAAGRCKKGTACTFAHSVAELMPRPVLLNSKARQQVAAQAAQPADLPCAGMAQGIDPTALASAARQLQAAALGLGPEPALLGAGLQPPHAPAPAPAAWPSFGAQAASEAAAGRLQQLTEAAHAAATAAASQDEDQSSEQPSPPGEVNSDGEQQPGKARARLNKFHKTQLCMFHQMGKCKKRASCRFAHGLDELRPVPDLYRTKLCPTMLSVGKCCDEECRFAHSADELRQFQADAGLDEPDALSQSAAGWQSASSPAYLSASPQGIERIAVSETFLPLKPAGSGRASSESSKAMSVPSASQFEPRHLQAQMGPSRPHHAVDLRSADADAMTPSKLWPMREYQSGDYSTFGPQAVGTASRLEHAASSSRSRARVHTGSSLVGFGEQMDSMRRYAINAEECPDSLPGLESVSGFMEPYTVPSPHTGANVRRALPQRERELQQKNDPTIRAPQRLNEGIEGLQPALGSYRTKLCPTLLNVGKCSDSSCMFAHSIDELRHFHMEQFRHEIDDWRPAPPQHPSSSSPAYLCADPTGGCIAGSDPLLASRPQLGGAPGLPPVGRRLDLFGLPQPEGDACRLDGEWPLPPHAAAEPAPAEARVPRAGRGATARPEVGAALSTLAAQEEESAEPSVPRLRVKNTFLTVQDNPSARLLPRSRTLPTPSLLGISEHSEGPCGSFQLDADQPRWSVGMHATLPPQREAVSAESQSMREFEAVPEMYHAQLCPTLLSAGKCNDDLCMYAHSVDQLQGFPMEQAHREADEARRDQSLHSMASPAYLCTSPQGVEQTADSESLFLSSPLDTGFASPRIDNSIGVPSMSSQLELLSLQARDSQGLDDWTVRTHVQADMSVMDAGAAAGSDAPGEDAEPRVPRLRVKNTFLTIQDHAEQSLLPRSRTLPVPTVFEVNEGGDDYQHSLWRDEAGAPDQGSSSSPDACGPGVSLSAGEGVDGKASDPAYVHQSLELPGHGVHRVGQQAGFSDAAGVQSAPTSFDAPATSGHTCSEDLLVADSQTLHCSLGGQVSKDLDEEQAKLSAGVGPVPEPPVEEHGACSPATEETTVRRLRVKNTFLTVDEPPKPNALPRSRTLPSPTSLDIDMGDSTPPSLVYQEDSSGSLVHGSADDAEVTLKPGRFPSRSHRSSMCPVLPKIGESMEGAGSLDPEHEQLGLPTSTGLSATQSAPEPDVRGAPLPASWNHDDGSLRAQGTLDSVSGITEQTTIPEEPICVPMYRLTPGYPIQQEMLAEALQVQGSDSSEQPRSHRYGHALDHRYGHALDHPQQRDAP